jgi:hypothetical protein
MNLQYKNIRDLLLVIAAGLTVGSCQKLTHPPLGDYPKDANPPGGPLKFYAAMDGSNVDSIRANFGVDNNVTYAGAGVSGKAAQFDGTKNGFIAWPSANDFGNSTDFSISFWLNIPLSKKDNTNADGVLAFANSKNFWSNVCFYADHTTGGPSDSMDLKIHFNADSTPPAPQSKMTDNWQAANYVGAKRWPHMYDGQWHHVAITYNAASQVFTAYRDGVKFDQMVMIPAIKFENSSQLIVGGFQEAAGIVDKYSNNTWMSGFPGSIDNVRLYGVTLAASDIQTLYTNKQ